MDDKEIKIAVDEFNSGVKDSEKIIIGVKAHKAETKEQLKERLKSIASYSCEQKLMTGAMCYRPSFPERKILEGICPKCGRKYQYEVWGSSKEEEHRRRQKKINSVVNKIKLLGYDIRVEHMCGYCYLQEYGTVPVYVQYLEDHDGATKVYEHILESNASVSVLLFRFDPSGEYTRNIVSFRECERLLDFLNGNNAYLGNRDDIHLLKDSCELIKHLLGI